MAARRKASSKKSAAANGAARGIGAIWKFIAKTLGSSVRFIFRGAQDLDPAHQRDGLAFLVFILGLISAVSIHTVNNSQVYFFAKVIFWNETTIFYLFLEGIKNVFVKGYF
jgi:hypothetical protein